MFSRIYGATEVPNITGGVNARADAERGATTDGQIIGCEARVIDPVSGAPLPKGGEGEIIARGPQMLIGYTQPQDADDSIDAEGFFHMGDLGRIVHDDFIVITGRKKDIIIRAGENISPKEVGRSQAILPLPKSPSWPCPIAHGQWPARSSLPHAGASITLAEMVEF